jgi:hypothetical protein
MKKYIILFIILLFFSCTLPPVTSRLFAFGTHNYKIENQLFFYDQGDISKNCTIIYNWINKNIGYFKNDYYPDINRIISLKAGDCTDKTFLMIDMLFYFFNYKATFVLVNKKTHCLVMYNKIYFDATIGEILTETELNNKYNDIYYIDFTTLQYDYFR